MPFSLPISRLAAALVLLAGVPAVPSAAAAAEPWPTTRFDVVAEGPEGQPAAGPLPAATEASLEAWLSQVAEYYESLGFRPPALEPMVATADGGRAYRVYLYDLEAAIGADATHVSPCTGATPLLLLNHDSLVAADGSRTDRSWTLVAHELFHAVQAGYRMFVETCDRGDWITEGTAEAVGLDTAWRLAGIDVYPDLPTMRWGGRRYDEPLYIRRNGDRRPRDAYRNASFWRYLGEVRAAGAGQPGPAQLPADYAYLHDFFDAGAGVAGTEAAELDWLHRQTSGAFGMGLPMTMAAFAGTLESWVPARGASPRLSEEGNRRAWRRALFGGCTPIVLSPEDPAKRAIQVLEPVSAGCFLVMPRVDGRASVSISVAAGDPALFDQLIFGAAEGRELLRPRAWQGPDGMTYGLWQFSLPGDGESVVVVTNVATPPSTTGAVTIPVDFILTSFESSLTTPTPEAPPPSEPSDSADRPDLSPKPGHADPPSPARDRVAEAAAERIAAGLEAASASANASTSVGRDVRAHPCAEPFVFLACGPSTRIGLMLLPGDSLDMGATFGRGGIAGQFMAMVEGMQQRGMAEVILEQQQAMERLASTAGSEIRITFPLIDYGFSGSFANAYISVIDGEGGALVSTGPGDAIPGRGRGYPLSGRVTIDQFTPTLMTGSFAADLVDVNESPEGDDAPRTVVASVEGRFTIATPLTTDDRFRLRDPTDPMAEAREDLAMAFPQLRGVLDQALADRGAGGGPLSGPGGGGGGAAAPVCDCSCNDPEAAAAARPDCVPHCEATWAACTAQPPPAVKPATAEDLAAEAAEIAALRERFAEALAGRGWPDSMVDGILDTFDQLETLGEKRFYMVAMGVPPPPEQP